MLMEDIDYNESIMLKKLERAINKDIWLIHLAKRYVEKLRLISFETKIDGIFLFFLQ